MHASVRVCCDANQVQVEPVLIPFMSLPATLNTNLSSLGISGIYINSIVSMIVTLVHCDV